MLFGPVPDAHGDGRAEKFECLADSGGEVQNKIGLRPPFVVHKHHERRRCDAGLGAILDFKIARAGGMGISVEEKEHPVFLKKLVEGKRLKSIIDGMYALEQIVEAQRCVEQGHKK